jgi:hypothetical protein
VGHVGDEPVPSIWSIQRVVLQLLCAAFMPANFTLVDFIEADPVTFRLLAEAKRKRRRQIIYSRKKLT